VAVSLVLLNHASSRFDGAGIVGVTIFFTLSGYLITGVLERGYALAGTRYLRRFYMHRALRLFPPLVFMLAVFAVVEGVFDRGGQRADLPAALAVALTYTSNLPPFDIRFDSLFHLWTLAVEEQFYLLWPLVLAWLAHRSGRRFRALTVAFVGTFVAMLATLVFTYPDAYKIYTLPTSWALALLTGAAVYFGRRRLDAVQDRHIVLTRAAVVLAVFVLAASCLVRTPSSTLWTYVAGVPVVALSAGLVVARVRRWGPRTDPFTRSFSALGIISYAVYLWNLPIVSWLGEPTNLPAALAPAALTITAATVSWWLVERPARALRARLDAGARMRVTRIVASSPVGSPGQPVSAADPRG
jgi:peptidoglycan/LPS O-acetylase OafA/YrhL